MREWGVVGAAIFVLVLILFTTINSKVLSDKEAVPLVEAVFTQVTPQGGVMSAQGESLEQVRVYVDRTMSMRPFTTQRQSPYFNLLKGLDELLAGSVRFYGFGYPSDQGDQVVQTVEPVLLEEPTQYTFVNNDYGPLFSKLSPTETHLVISDGVQSEPEQGERFGGLVSPIGRWIEQGGVFSLIAFRAPYEGTYFHEAPTVGRIEYSCDDRPFYIFGFFPSVKAKTELLDILKGGGVSPFYSLTVGEASASVRARANEPPEDPTAPRGPRVLTAFSTHGDSSPKVSHVYSGRSAKKGGNVSPLQFAVTFDSTSGLWSRLSEDAMGRVARSLDPSFRHWRIDTLSVPRKKASLTRLRAPEVIESTSHLGESSRNAWLETSLSFNPDQRMRLASLLTVGLSPAGANSLVPDALSTRRDDRAAACSRTLNIQPMIGVILRKHYVVGRALLVTEWM
jgi:hypothetical protein